MLSLVVFEKGGCYDGTSPEGLLSFNFFTPDNLKRFNKKLKEKYSFLQNLSSKINCGVNRKEASGVCMQSEKARLTNAVVHTGEEPPLIQGSGAGAVFFSGCAMKCCYCQNLPSVKEQRKGLYLPGAWRNIPGFTKERMFKS